MASRIIQFFRPTFYCLIAFGAVLGVHRLYQHSPAASDALGLSPSELMGIDLAQVVLPSPNLSPEQVVQLQLAGLSDPRADGAGILQCFVFASPGNRAATGPLERFGHMVRQGPYHCMAHPRALLIGRPQKEEGVARLLVTLMDENSTLQAFTFVLVKQQHPMLKDCWMTEAVMSSLPQEATSSAPVPQSAPST